VIGNILFPITDGRLIIGFTIAARFVFVDHIWKSKVLPMDGKEESPEMLFQVLSLYLHQDPFSWVKGSRN
jgi:hypothetical protein